MGLKHLSYDGLYKQTFSLTIRPIPWRHATLYGRLVKTLIVMGAGLNWLCFIATTIWAIMIRLFIYGSCNLGVENGIFRVMCSWQWTWLFLNVFAKILIRKLKHRLFIVLCCKPVAVDSDIHKFQIPSTLKESSQQLYKKIKVIKL